MRIAVLADIHGNHLALDAVLADLEWRGGADRIVNLGDCVSGPLWPAETMERLDRLNAVIVRGNHDRVVAEASPGAMIASDRFAFDALAPDQREWLGALPIRASPTHGVMACHATPSHDETYLIEEIEKVWSGEISAEEYLKGHQEIFDAEREAGAVPPIPER